MVLHLRIISPSGLTDQVLGTLSVNSSCTNLVVLPGAGRHPDGDLLLADVAREAVSEVLHELEALGLPERGSIAVESVDLSLSTVADQAEAGAPGYGSDAVVWEELVAPCRPGSPRPSVAGRRRRGLQGRRR